jgi:hypothetical protein
MEDYFGADFRAVRLHRTLATDSANRCIGSVAFTIGEHIGFGSGFDESYGSLFNYVLAHELTHVLQKRLPKRTFFDCSLEAPSALEREAVWVASGVLAGQSVCVGLSDTAEVPRFWGPAGHYYTVYLCSIWAKCSISEAYSNAFFAQMPDQVEELDATESGYDIGRNVAKLPFQFGYREGTQIITDINVQRGLHALTGGKAGEETFKRRKILEYLKPGLAFSLALHAFGDSFAHRKSESDESQMYSPPLGHAAELLSFKNPYKVDYINLHQKLYMDYGKQMFDILCSKFGKLPKEFKEQRRQQLEKHLEVISNEPNEDLQIRKILGITAVDTGEIAPKYYPELEKLAPWNVFRLNHPELPSNLLETAIGIARAWR